MFESIRETLFMSFKFNPTPLELAFPVVVLAHIVSNRVFSK